jgi:ComEC/Rec2-related protein
LSLTDKINIAKFEALVPALFFGGYFFSIQFTTLASIFLSTLLYVVREDLKKRTIVLFSIFLLFSGNAVRSRDESIEDKSFFNKIKAPSIIEKQREKIDYISTSKVNSHLVKALGIGKREFSEKLRDSLIVTGTMHLVAISAFHTGIMIVFLNFIFKILFLFAPVGLRTSTAISLITKLLASIYYFYLTGSSVPTLRALVFILFYDAVYASGKKPDPLTLYFFSLTGVSVLIPQSAVSISFIMSALCVATVIQIWNRLPTSVSIKIITVSVLINYVLMPVSVSLTGCYPLASPFINLLVIPLFTLCVPFISLAQFSIPFFSGGASFFLTIADNILTPAIFHINYFSELSTKLMMPLIDPGKTVKILFVGSFFASLSVSGKTRLILAGLNVSFIIFFIFSYNSNSRDTFVLKPQNLFGSATCVVFRDSSGHIFFDSGRNNPGTTTRFYHRMERAAAECKINKVLSVTTRNRFQKDAENKLKSRWRFKSTVFKAYLQDEVFDRNQFDGSSLRLSDQVQ